MFGGVGLAGANPVRRRLYGSIPELADVIALAAQGELNAEVETFPLEKAPEAYERLRQGTIRGRAVVTPGS